MSDTVSTNPTESAGERQTPTPLTDKECERTDCDYYLSGYVDSDFARTLERERAQKELDRRYHMDAINRLAKYLDCYETSDSIIDRAISDLTAARQRIAGLEAMVEKADKAMWDATGELASLADVVASALRNTQMYAVAEEMGGQPDLREYIWMLSYAANTQRSRAESAESRLAAVEAERDGVVEECALACQRFISEHYSVRLSPDDLADLAEIAANAIRHLKEKS